MKEVIMKVPDDVSEDQLKRIGAEEFIRCEKCVSRKEDCWKCSIMDGLNITKEFYCAFAQKKEGD